MDATYTIGSDVACSDRPCGTLTRVIVDPIKRALTYLVVEPDEGPGAARLVPVGYVDADDRDNAITLRCDRAEFDALEYAVIEEFLPAQDDDFGYGAKNTLWMPYFPLGGLPAGPIPGPGGFVAPPGPEPRPVQRERVPLGEVQIKRGRAVHATDGDIGKVRGLAVDERNEQVTHVLLEEGHLWGKKTVAIPIGAVMSVADGIHIDLSKDEVRDLPEIQLEAR
ncbi:MAG TPA: PRC-barrel domain-containing protein [Actinospica sp.]|jgi:sporulation protein YlmC with PRC-barrel domain|nr:PRC-barrel domain-containing protein [Actinospica sp.]